MVYLPELLYYGVPARLVLTQVKFTRLGNPKGSQRSQKSNPKGSQRGQKATHKAPKNPKGSNETEAAQNKARMIISSITNVKSKRAHAPYIAHSTTPHNSSCDQQTYHPADGGAFSKP